MSAAAGVIFTREFEPRLQRLAGSLQQLAQSIDQPLERWLIHALTVMTSCVVTVAVMMFLLRD
jgi:predicted PurR-regulated permease PerM